jgi:hypothetical protein
MAQLLSDIKTSLGNAYIAQTAVQTAYNLSASDIESGFDALFSKVSVENLLFYAVASVIYLFEVILDAFQSEVQTTVTAAYIANKAWWHTQAMSFQKGYALLMNATTFVFAYATIDTTAQIIQRCAVRESLLSTGVCKLQLYVATETNGNIAPLSDSDITLFTAYANQIKPAGVLIDVITGAADVVDLGITIDFDPLLLDSTGRSILNGNYPVIDAINNFINTLNNVDFGGNLNISKLINTMLAVDGVADVEVTSFAINTVTQPTWGTFASKNGWFVIGTIIPTYQPYSE